MPPRRLRDPRKPRWTDPHKSGQPCPTPDCSRCKHHHHKPCIEQGCDCPAPVMPPAVVEAAEVTVQPTEGGRALGSVRGGRAGTGGGALFATGYRVPPKTHHE